jgi:hypothetical protein
MPTGVVSRRLHFVQDVEDTGWDNGTHSLILGKEARYGIRFWSSVRMAFVRVMRFRFTKMYE